MSTYSSEVIETNQSVENANKSVKIFLNTLTKKKYVSENKTKGFTYRYTPKWYNPFNFDIYVGNFSKATNTSIIRLETPKHGEEQLYKQLIETKVLKQPIPKDKKKTPIQSKSHIISQTLNLITPGASVLYNSYKSPLYTTSDTLTNTSFYLLADLLIIGIASWYSDQNLPKKGLADKMLNKQGPNRSLFTGPYSGVLIGVLMIPRAFRMIGSYHDTGTQNRMAELSYTYHF
ncbi:MAG: hypothetical protein H7A23_02130 [Leptospiraceae bacterium]|nr:hypothetical protein [Leptospiraceae bacterium]MCP5493328.1 hypothetical protein [Leptospiraceae bacterium]